MTQTKTNNAYYTWVSYIMLAVVAALSLFLMIKSWGVPLLEQHGFRQTQTAITTYWLLHGGNWLAYETPVFGTPWTIPFEFPLYQWIVACFAYLLPVSLDNAGRLVSYAFHVGCLVPLSIFFDLQNLSRRTFLFTAILFLAAPVYLFWGRSFLIESTALFFSIGFAAAYAAHLRHNIWYTGMLACLLGTVGALVKITTFAPFAVLAVAMAIPVVLNHLQTRSWGRLTACVLSFAGATGVILVVLKFWLYYSDYLKSQNVIGKTLTSAGLSGWNFGTFAQKTGLALWHDTLLGRAVPEAVGSVYVLVAALVLAITFKLRVRKIVVLLGVYLLSFLLFTNLHIVHNYYQYANAIFLVAAIGITAGELFEKKPVIALLLLGVVVAVQTIVFSKAYYPSLKQDFSKSPILEVARFIQGQTPGNTAIMVLGSDWSSAIPYYAERKALMLPNFITEERAGMVAQNPDEYTAPLPISAFLFFRNVKPNPRNGKPDRVLINRLADRIAANNPSARIVEVGECQILMRPVSGQAMALPAGSSQ